MICSSSQTGAFLLEITPPMAAGPTQPFLNSSSEGCAVPVESRATIGLDFADGAEGGAADGWGGHGGGGSWSGFEDRGGWPDWANTAAPPAYPAAGPLAL